jgi:hypothetical protein
MIGPISQFAGNLERRRLRLRGHVGAEQFAQSQIGVFQFSLRIVKFRALVGRGDLSPLNIQFTHDAGAKSFLLVIEFFI